MAFIDEKTKGSNKEVMQKIMQSAYDRKIISRAETDNNIERLQEFSPLYEGIEIKYRDEDLTDEERGDN